MSFQTDLDPFDKAYAHFVRAVREAIQQTFAEEVPNGLTQKEIAETLGIDAGLVSRRLNSPGNMTLRSLADLYTAMGREPLSNFEAPKISAVDLHHAYPVMDVPTTTTVGTFSANNQWFANLADNAPKNVGLAANLGFLLQTKAAG